MKASLQESGEWSIEATEGDKPLSGPYLSTLKRYLQCMTPAFTGAHERCEFEFILALLRVRGIQDAGWDPFETTLRAIPAMTVVHESMTDLEAARHLHLWIYGHILEASEPYELLANMIAISQGGRWFAQRFPPVPGKGNRPPRELSPGEKIVSMERVASAASMPQVATPLREIWDRELRNAVFHADYVLHGSEVRILRPHPKKYSNERVMELVNGAHAYHTAIKILYRAHVGMYTESNVIPVHPEFSPDPDDRAVILVREGHGVIGMRDAWTAEEIAAGRVTHLIGNFRAEELTTLHRDRTVTVFPAETPPKFE